MTREEFTASVWDRIVARYLETPGLRELCLELQELYDADVIMALFLRAADDAGLSPSPEQITALRDAVSPWRGKVVKQLRSVRQWLKPRIDNDKSAAFRDKIKALELEAERFELEDICQSFNSMTSSPTTDHRSAAARHYLEDLGADPIRISRFCDS